MIGGLITSTLLTRTVVPVAYTDFDDPGAWPTRPFLPEQRERKLREVRERAALAPEPAWGD